MSLRFARGVPGRCLTVSVGAAIVIAAGCSNLPSDPKTPFAIEFNRAPGPSVVLGDTLFDSTGAVQPLRAIVYNSQGEEIVGAPVTYRVVAYDAVAATNPTFRDSVPLTVDPGSGYVVGKAAPAYAGKTARVYAQAGGLQSQTIILTATRSADALIAVGQVVDTLALRFATVDSLIVAPGPSVALRHRIAGGTAADSTVPAYLVRFSITRPNGAATDTSYVMLTNGDRKRSELDTTDATGNASRQIRVRRVNFPFSKPAAANDTIYDSVIVQSSAVKKGGTLVPGSGLQFLLIIKAHKQ